MAWQDIVAEKQKAADGLIPSGWKLSETIWGSLSLPLESNPNRLLTLDIPRRSGLFCSRELEITEEYNTAQLLDALRNGQLSSLEVTTAFCKRAAVAQQLTNCLTEVFFQNAFSR